MMDYSALLFDPVFGELAVPATMNGIDVTVIDETRAKSQTTGSASGVVDVRSVGPAAVARIPELTGKGIARADYKDAALSFNGRSWAVRSYDLLGSPNGEDLGLVRLFLMATA